MLAERGAVAESTAVEQPMISEREFAELQARLRRRNQTSSSIREAAEVELEGFWPSVADHNMDRYIEKILRQIG